MRKHRMKWIGGAFALGMVAVMLFLTLMSSSSVANAQSRNTLECPALLREVSMPENSFVDLVWTNGYTGVISYTTSAGVASVLALDFIDWEAEAWARLHPYFRHYPVRIEPGAASVPSLARLEGKCIKESVFKYEACVYNGGSGPWQVYWDRWTFQAKQSEDPSACSGGDGGGDGGNVGPAEFEGFTVQVNPPEEIMVRSELGTETFAVTTETAITRDGNSATLYDLQYGDKAKVSYDPATRVALEIKAEQP